MSHSEAEANLGQEGSGEDKPESVTTQQQNPDAEAIGQSLLQTALGNLQAMLQQNAPASSPSLIVPPSVTNTASEEKNATPMETSVTVTETAPEEDAGSGAKRVVPEKKLPSEPGKLNPGRRKGIGLACRYLRGEKITDFEITTLPELIEYIQRQTDEAVIDGLITAYNSAFPENEAEHLSASAIEGHGKGPETKKPRVAPPFDFAKYWAPGQHDTAQLNALHHFTKHQEDGGFACGSAEEYTERARRFISQNSRSAQAQKGDENKEIMCTYSRGRQAGLFLVRDSASKILTFYVLTPATVAQYGTMSPEQYLATKVDDLSSVITD